jgi:hypothetical protein
MHLSLGRLHGAGLGREAHPDFTLEFSGGNMAGIIAEAAREPALAAGAIYRFRRGIQRVNPPA